MNVYAFTGIPGTGVQMAMRRVAELLGSQTTTICLDDYLWQAFCDHARNDSALLATTELSAHQIDAGAKPDWWQMLILPPRRVRQLWAEAAKRARKEVEQLSDTDTALISFHAVYYSDFYRWRFSAVDPRELQGFGFKAFFCLIDDIYDIQARRRSDLEAERSLIDPKATTGERFERLVRHTVDRLDQFVAWRQEEIVFTDYFADTCGVPAHVVAVKHPAATVARLVRDPSMAYYLSHPITAVRTSENFVEGDLYRSVVDFVEHARELTTIIEPTTIDEFRFKRIRVGANSVATPFLGKRWPAPDGLLLVDEVEAVRNETPEVICAHENIANLNLCDHVKSESDASSTLSAGVLDAVRRLEERIAEDITWRDHRLVDQTGRLLVFRPVGGGFASTGVKREVQYLAKLLLTRALEGSCMVIHPKTDRDQDYRRVSKAIIESLSAAPDLTAVFHPPLNEGGEGLLDALVAAVTLEMEGGRNLPMLAKRIVEAIADLLRIEPPTSGAKPMSSGKVSAFRDEKRLVVRSIEQRIEDKLASEFYLDALAARLPKEAVTIYEENQSAFDHLKGQSH